MAPELVKDIRGYIFINLLLFFYNSIKHKFECDIWSIAMILFEMMESDYPYIIRTSKFDQQEDVKKGEVKKLKVKRSPDLVSLYQSLKKIVYN
jgi:serine/threonine protein kinase